jgi:uncharacterized protein (TIGR03437 family)
MELHFVQVQIFFNTSAPSQIYLVQSPLVTGNAGKAVTTSAASYRSPKLAKDSIATIFGTNLTNATMSAVVTPLPTTLANTTVKIKDNSNTEKTAALFYVSPSQINFQIPAGVIPGDVTVTISSGDGVTQTTGSFQIIPSAPGIFTANANGQGAAAAIITRVKADNSQIIEQVAQFDAGKNSFIARPIDLGADQGAATDRVLISLFGTGLRNSSNLSSLIARIGCEDAVVTYAGPQPNFVGLDQINLLIPRALIGKGLMDIVLTINGQSTNAVQINIK